MPKNSLNVSLKGADDIFSTEESRQEQQREQVQQIPIGELFPFKNHPFKVLDDESMQRTVESVEQYGVLSPLIARPRPEGGYEIISGHRRQHAAQLAGLDTLPVIVRQMDDDAAVLLMVDSNLQRETILPSERAFAYKMKLEAMKHQAGRPTQDNYSQVGNNFGTLSSEEMAEELGTSKNQIFRYIRLTNLVPELLDMVDEKKIAFNPAVELSYLDESQQRDFLEAMDGTQNAPSVSQAQQLKLEQQGYEIKRGKHTSVKGARQKRFIRFRTLGAGYSEDEIKAVIAGEAERRPHQKQPPKEQLFHLLVDIQAKLSEGKDEGYARWAKRYNLKEMSKTLIFLQENKIGSIEEMQERVNAATAQYHELGDSIKAAEQRMAEIAVLRTHIVNYARTRPVYDAYRKSGYSKKFLEEHREQITLHKAAKAAFDESNLRTLPKVKELDAEYSNLLTEKKARYPDYRKAKEEMQELLRAKRNVELFFAEEKSSAEKTKSR